MTYTRIKPKIPRGFSQSQSIAMAPTVDMFAGDVLSPQSEEGVLWNSSGTATLLTPPSGGSSVAYDVNYAGQSCGDVNNTSGSPIIAATWSSTGALTELSNPTGSPGPDSSAAAINSAGDAVGWAGTVTGQTEAIYWNTDGDATVLSSSNAVADGINHSGQIVGSVETGSNRYAAMWSASTGGLVWQSPDAASGAYAINAAGVSCGGDGSEAVT